MATKQKTRDEPQEPSAPRGRHGLSPVGRVKAAALAARHTSFVAPFTARASLSSLSAKKDELDPWIAQATPLIGPDVGSLARDIAARAAAPDPTVEALWTTTPPLQSRWSPAALLVLLDSSPRRRRPTVAPADPLSATEPYAPALETWDDPTYLIPTADSSLYGHGPLEGDDGGDDASVPTPARRDLLDAALDAALEPAARPQGREPRSITPLVENPLRQALVLPHPWSPTAAVDPFAVGLPSSEAAALLARGDGESEGDTPSPPHTLGQLAVAAPFTSLEATNRLVGSVQRSADAGSPDPTIKSRDEALHETETSSGTPLDPTTRTLLEHMLGVDAGAVQVHTDAPATTAATALSARAFAVGDDVYFAAGAYQPHDPAGLALVGHEVVHTVQQKSGAAPSSSPDAEGRRLTESPQRAPVAADELGAAALPADLQAEAEAEEVERDVRTHLGAALDAGHSTTSLAESILARQAAPLLSSNPFASGATANRATGNLSGPAPQETDALRLDDGRQPDPTLGSSPPRVRALSAAPPGSMNPLGANAATEAVVSARADSSAGVAPPNTGEEGEQAARDERPTAPETMVEGGGAVSGQDGAEDAGTSLEGPMANPSARDEHARPPSPAGPSDRLAPLSGAAGVATLDEGEGEVNRTSDELASDGDAPNNEENADARAAAGDSVGRTSPAPRASTQPGRFESTQRGGEDRAAPGGAPRSDGASSGLGLPLEGAPTIVSAASPFDAASGRFAPSTMRGEDAVDRPTIGDSGLRAPLTLLGSGVGGDLLGLGGRQEATGPPTSPPPSGPTAAAMIAPAGGLSAASSPSNMQSGGLDASTEPSASSSDDQTSRTEGDRLPFGTAMGAPIARAVAGAPVAEGSEGEAAGVMPYAMLPSTNRSTSTASLAAFASGNPPALAEQSGLPAEGLSGGTAMSRSEEENEPEAGLVAHDGAGSRSSASLETPTEQEDETASPVSPPSPRNPSEGTPSDGQEGAAPDYIDAPTLSMASAPLIDRAGATAMARPVAARPLNDRSALFADLATVALPSQGRSALASGPGGTPSASENAVESKPGGPSPTFGAGRDNGPTTSPSLFRPLSTPAQSFAASTLDESRDRAVRTVSVPAVAQALSSDRATDGQPNGVEKETPWGSANGSTDSAVRGQGEIPPSLPRSSTQILALSGPPSLAEDLGKRSLDENATETHVDGSSSGSEGSSHVQRISPAFGAAAPTAHRDEQGSETVAPYYSDYAVGGAAAVLGGAAANRHDAAGGMALTTASATAVAPAASTSVAPSSEPLEAAPLDPLVVEDIVDAVLTRVRRQLALDHERAGGFQPDLMR